MAVQTKILHRRDTAANWTSTNPTLSAGELGFETDTLKFKVGDGSTAWTSLKYSQDASLLNGTASITAITTTGDVTVGGNLTVNGTTTSLNSSTIQVDDKNIELASVAAIVGRTGTATSSNTTITASNTSGLIIGQSITRTAGASMATGTIATIVNATAFTVTNAPSTSGSITFDIGGATDTTADGAGLTVLGTTNKTWSYANANTAWESSENVNIVSGKTYRVANTTVLSATQVLGYSIASANGASTIVARDANGDFAANVITASLTGTASLAANVSGGTAGQLLYQSGANATAKLTVTATNNQVLVYNTATSAPAWSGTPNIGAATGTSVNVSGQLISTQTTGTAPLAVSSTTVVTNLNADLLDGYNTATAATVNTVAVRDANGSLTANVFIGSSANVTGQLISTVATGTAPFSVASTTKVANLNADTLDGYDTATAATANTVAVRDANASITANVFIGASANVTGQLISTVATGTAPLVVTSTTQVANLKSATAGVADSATIAGQANNITGAANLIFYNSAANTTTTLAAPAANNYVLSANTSGAPFWAAPTATGVTNVATGAGLTGGPITSTGTISLNTAYATTWTTTQRINVSTDVLVFGIKANTTQTANIFEARDGAATMMMSLSNTGTLYAVTIDGGSA